MTWTDPIVEDVRRARETYAARFAHDLQAMFHDLKEQEKHGGRKVVSFFEGAIPKPDRVLRATDPAPTDPPSMPIPPPQVDV